MGLLPRFFRRWSYRRRRDVGPEAFIAHLKSEFRRPLDGASRSFFHNHPVSTGILHEILAGRLQTDGTHHDERVITTLLNDMAFSTADLDPGVFTSRTPLSDVLEAFAATTPDAGNVIGQAVIRFLKLPRPLLQTNL